MRGLLRTTAGRRRARAAAFALLPLGAALCVAGVARAQTRRAMVFYPAGDCPSGKLELEVWERGPEGAGGRWVPHPEHPTIEADSCQPEDPGVLLNELRVRCVGSASSSEAASAWVVGADLSKTGPAPSCPPL